MSTSLYINISAILLFLNGFFLVMNFKKIYNFVLVYIKNVKIPYVVCFLLFIGSFTLATSGVYRDDVNLSSSNYYQITVMFLCGLFVAVGYMLRIKYINRSFNVLVTLFTLYFFANVVSALFSDFILFSIYKSSLIFLYVLFVFVVVTYEFKFVLHVYQLIVFFYSFLIIVFLTNIVLFSDTSLVINKGVLGFQLYNTYPVIHPNTTGFIAVISFSIFFNRTFNSKLLSKLLYITLSLSSFMVIFLAQSRTSMVCLVFSIFFILLFRKKIVHLILAIFLLFIIFINQIESISEYFYRGATEVQMETLSGRTELWQYGWKKFWESPILGYGFATGSRISLLSGSNFHNSYFEVLINTGLVGFVFWFCTLFYTTIKTFLLFFKRFNDYKLDIINLEITSLLIISILRTFTGAIFIYHDYTFLLFSFFIIYASYNINFNIREKVYEKNYLFYNS